MPAVPLHLTGYPDVQLTADCSNCFALCCSALGFRRSSDFAHDKPLGDACHNLATDFSCTIHTRLRSSGYKGCTVFDCFGAGQKVAQEIFGGRSWTAHPEVRSVMFSVFPVMRQLHEVLWYLDEAHRRCADLTGQDALAKPVSALIEETVALTRQDAEGFGAVDLDGLRKRTGKALAAVSAVLRTGVARGRIPKRLRPGADLLGADLAGRALHGADLRGAYLLAADLTGSDLHFVDLLGADLRDAALHGADLSQSLFLTPMQIAAARGDHRTRLPARIVTPAHWLG